MGQQQAQPTREQFDAAAKRVMETAPPGLSRDEFFARIDAEIAKSQPHTLSGDVGQMMNTQPSVGTPTTGGFLRNAAKDVLNTATGMIDFGNKALQDPIGAARALPAGIMHRVHQYTSDMDPAAAWEQLKSGRPGAALGNLLPVGEAYQRPASMATDVYAGSQLAKLAGNMIKSGSRMSTGAIPRQVEGEVVDPTLRHGATEGSIVEDAPLPQRPKALPPGRYEMGGEVRDASGRVVAPPQTDIPPRPPGPWDMNVKTGSSAPMGDDAIYDHLMEQMGGKATGGDPPSSSHTGAIDREAGGNIPLGGAKDTHHPASMARSTFPPEGGQGDWHAYADDAERAAADPTERAQASNLHKETRALDDRYDYLTDPANENSGFVDAGSMIARMLTRMLKDEVTSSMRRSSPDTIGRTAGFFKPIIKKAPAFGAVSRLNRPEDEQ